MGAHPYWYFVPYDASPAAALDRLRRREFEAGRYSPVVRAIDFADPIQREAEHGRNHATIEAAVAEAAETGEGTRSILDIEQVSMEFERGAAAPFAAEDLVSAFGTERPSRSLVERQMIALLEGLDRGQCGYLVVFDGEKPTSLFFAGYSYD
jgi:hypothetical protein